MRNNSTSPPWALSRIDWPPRAWNVPLSLLAAVAGFVVLAIVQTAYFGIALATGSLHLGQLRDTQHIPADHLLYAQLATYLPTCAYALAVIPRLARTSLADLGFGPPSARDLRAALAGTVVMWIAVSVVGATIASLSHRHDTEQAIALMRQLHAPLEQALFFVVACVLAPLFEELVFRVFLFNALSRYAPVWVAAIVSGIVFGAAHVANPPELLTVGTPLALGGIVLAYVYARTRSYWATVATHGCFNAISVIAIFVFHAT